MGGRGGERNNVYSEGQNRKMLYSENSLPTHPPANDVIASGVHIILSCGSQIWLCFPFLSSVLGLLSQSP